MVYHSLFDEINIQCPNFDSEYNRLDYFGTLLDVIDQLDRALINTDSLEKFFNLVLHPPRIIRALLDYKILNPSLNVEFLLDEVLELSLGIYRRNLD